MINVLIISLHASPNMAPGVSEWGGTHTYMKELLQEIDYSEFNVVLATRKVYEWLPTIQHIRQNCVQVNLNFGEYEDFDKRKIPEYAEKYTKELIDILATLKFIPSVIHSVYWNSGFLASELSEYYKVNYVHSIISNGQGRIIRGAKDNAENRLNVEQKVYEHAKYIICVGNSEKQEIVDYYCIAPQKIFVAGQFVHPSYIYPAHNEFLFPRMSTIYGHSHKYLHRGSTFTKTNDWHAHKAFIYVGRISKYKGVHYIVTAWIKNYKKYADNCPPLWVVGGDTKEIEEMRRVVKEEMGHDIEVPERECKLVWWSYLDEAGVSTLYMESLCLITNSQYEPGGRVAVEALAEGLPVIASPNGFAKEIIENWCNGFLVDNGDIDELAFRMEHFIKNPYLSLTMREDAICTGIETIKYWNFIDLHMTLYKAAYTNNAISPEKPPIYKHKKYERKLNAYPFCSPSLQKEDVFRLALRLIGGTYVDNIEKCQPENASSEVWRFSVDGEKYLCKIPYSRLEYRAFYQKFNTDYIYQTGYDRYATEKLAATYNGFAPIFAMDDGANAIIRKEFTANKNISFQHIIKDIENVYKNNPYNGKDFDALNRLIEENAPIHVIDAFYIKHCQGGFLENTDYSLRVETRRWKENFEDLDRKRQQKISVICDDSFAVLYNIAINEKTYLPVLNIGGCNIKNLVFDNGVTMFVDNERAHWGWGGIDYADLMPTYANIHAQPLNWWDAVLSNFSSEYISVVILLGWLILDGIKALISEQVIDDSKADDEIIRRQKYYIQYASRLLSEQNG